MFFLSILHNRLVPIHPSRIQWSAHSDAVEPVFIEYHKFKCVLLDIVEDADQNGDSRNDAKGSAKKMMNIEFSIMCELWRNALKHFNSCREDLQSSTTQLTTEHY